MASLPQQNGCFRVALTLMALSIGGCAIHGGDTPVPSAAEAEGWSLVWADEFSSPGLPDSTRWDYDVGGQGWGNNELQYYTERRAENARVGGGHLIIEARHEAWLDSSQYTSARLVTRGHANWRYGRFEIRARLPAGRGTWPAIWMLPWDWDLGNGSWPDNGEIDIIEHVGYDPGVVHATVHTKAHNHIDGTQISRQIEIADAQSAFHTYALEWDAQHLTAYVDREPYFTHTPGKGDWTVWPYDRPFYLILNIAVGGNWGGVQGVDASVFPQRLEVDFVRVYQRVD
jgi:beta-glucanase (GH16 family)